MKKYVNISIVLLLMLIMSNCNINNSKTKNNQDISDSLLVTRQLLVALMDSINLNFKQGKLSDAIPKINECIALKQNQDFFYNLRGYCLMLKGSINDSLNNRMAINDFTKAIEINGSKAKYYNNRGWSYQMLHKYLEALTDYQTAVKIDPYSVNFNGNILRMMFITKKYEAAIKLCDSLILKFPNDGYAYYVRGQLKRDYLHKYLEGNKDVQRANELGWNQGIKILY